MAYDDYEGKNVDADQIRDLFSLESLLHSSWYAARLETQKQVALGHCAKQIAYLRGKLKAANEADCKVLDAKLKYVQKQRESIRRKDAQKAYMHTLGTDPAILANSAT